MSEGRRKEHIPRLDFTTKERKAIEDFGWCMGVTNETLLWGVKKKMLGC